VSDLCGCPKLWRCQGVPGIGTGHTATQGISRIGQLTIQNTNVTADAINVIGSGGSGIGTGVAYNGGNSRIGDLTIQNGNVTGNTQTAWGSGGSGIGTGYAYDSGDSGIGNLTIDGGNVTGKFSAALGAGGGSGIGTGAADGGNSAIDNFRVSGGVTLFCNLFRAPKIVGSNASVFIFTQSASVFERAPDLSGTVSLTILYPTTRTAIQESVLTDFPYLSIGNARLPTASGWRFCVSGGNCSQYVLGAPRSLFTFVSCDCFYWVIAEGSQRGFLGPASGGSPFEVSSPGSVFQDGYFSVIAPTRTPQSTPTPMATPKPTPTRTLTQTPTRTPNPTATRTETPIPTPKPSPSPEF
jgi:hypothetical protein